MFLRRLTIKGFKSFADRTVFDFSPGVSVIVGPNGSGKSNLTEAIAWVLGEQGPKTLRGGKMEDVIFAGTPKRPSLGRAEVELTIDNSAGVLPIDLTEVAIKRTLFRSGESEYAINGTQCRLLDILELLSDTGVGRELHTIVGQGNLDAILAGGPDDRRAVIEEAAGLLKHRKRKDRAVRKLERVDADIERLTDVINELRRQIRPLERQAELAKRAEEIHAEMREVRLKLWVLDYRAVTSEDEADAERRAIEEAERLTALLADLDVRTATLEADLAEAARVAEARLSTGFRLSGIADRLEALARLADERAQRLDDMAAREPRGDAPTLDEIAAAEVAAAAAAEALQAAHQEAQRAESDRMAVQSAREEAARIREEVVHLHGERAALRASVDAADDERRRLLERRGTVMTVVERGEADGAEARAELERLDAEETTLDRRMEQVEERLAEQRTQLASLTTAHAASERKAESLTARRAVLADELARETDPSDLVRRPEIAGRVTDQVRAHPGYERALVAALGALADAVLAPSRAEAMVTLEGLKSDGGRASIAVPGTSIYAPVPVGVRALVSVVENEGPYADLVRGLLSGIALAGSLAEASELSRQYPTMVIVTADGDRLGPNVITGGAPVDARDPRNDLRAVDAELQALSASIEAQAREIAHAQAELSVIEAEHASIDERMHELDARVAGATERLAQAERERAAALRDDSMLAGRATELEERSRTDGERLREIEERLARVVDSGPAIDPVAAAQIERQAAERSLRLGEATERERASRHALEEMRSRAERVRVERERWEAGRGAWEAASKRAAAVATTASALGERLTVWVAEASEARQASEARRRDLETELGSVRAQRRQAEADLESARSFAHEADLRRAERTHRIRSLVERLREEHQMSPTEAAEAVSVDPADEDELRRKGQTLERRLQLLGNVNPIAMEQYAGLVERHRFLTEQVDDLKASRRDLMSVVNEVDRKIVEVFSEAFADVAREFAAVFGRLFPGGEGGLVLTDPDDMLNTGVEVEARPAGKRVKRVSLLSGGERSLVSVALLFSVFRARPSPFYVLDEVEAALDDANLGRFLMIAQEFRETSQLLIVTHQKRTMEIADALYGISMAGEGVSRVICERLDGVDRNEPAQVPERSSADV